MKKFIVFIFVVILLGCDDSPAQNKFKGKELPEWVHISSDDRILYIVVGIVAVNDTTQFEFMLNSDKSEFVQRLRELLTLGLDLDTHEIEIFKTDNDIDYHIATLMMYFKWADKK
jgi:hypothetical protein